MWLSRFFWTSLACSGCGCPGSSGWMWLSRFFVPGSSSGSFAGSFVVEALIDQDGGVVVRWHESDHF